MTFRYAIFTSIFLLAPLAALAAPAAPFANTLSPTFVTEQSAQLNGNVNPNETTDTYQWFEWGVGGSAGVYETSHLRIGNAKTLVVTNAKLIGLAPHTQYFYRQVAENGHGKVTGSTMYFTTAAIRSQTLPPVMAETRPATKIGETSATLNGYVSPHGNASAEWWFEYGEDGQLMTLTRKYQSGGNARTVEQMITNLTPGTTYNFRLVAEDGTTATGNTLSLTTAGRTPIPVETSSEVARLKLIDQLNQRIIALMMQLIGELQKQIAALNTK